MLVVNKLTVPGGIRRVDINPEMVKVTRYGGEVKVYVAVTDNKEQEAGIENSTGNQRQGKTVFQNISALAKAHPDTTVKDMR